MQNGHFEAPILNPYQEFATKIEVHLLESQVRELTKESAWMAAAIKNFDNTVKNLDETVKEANKTLKLLVDNKSINDKLKLHGGRCLCWIVGTSLPMLIAHWTGILKMIFKYFMS